MFNLGDRISITVLYEGMDSASGLAIGDAGIIVKLGDNSGSLNMGCYFVKFDKRIPHGVPNLEPDGTYVVFGKQIKLIEDEYDDEPEDTSQLKASFNSMFE